ncbi:hypothetical protein K6119_12045 [Paracrocinitomix mangrovi]|uniref:YbhB/YbcL family Raf kinase inhibitor-like protein n=1 Tax=Paracrocinitomix mangrovi TaxID=2862509 RepID=UPI001C8EA9AE|nr:hypothetical protein [Paracrocinitomix mangrovi]UKN00463.1 hypothetical protein K6119_12045 [Paracrocinitomix mangrovi]
MKKLPLLLLFAGMSVLSSCKKKGCTDINASNYSAEAEKDDKSCQYDFYLRSDAIDENGELMADYKCEDKVNGIEASIPLKWGNVPDGTGSMAIIMQHFPNPNDQSQANSYLLLWDISPSVTEMPHGTADDGPWFMGSNKDGDYISYTSPCSPDPGTHAYEIILYALSETPASLPAQSDISVDWQTLKDAIATVTVIDTAVLEFNDVN